MCSFWLFRRYLMPVLWCPANCSLGKNAIFERKPNKKRTHSLNAFCVDIFVVVVVWRFIVCAMLQYAQHSSQRVKCGPLGVKRKENVGISSFYGSFMSCSCQRFFYSFGFYFTSIFGHCGDNTIMNTMIYGGSRLKNVLTKLRARYDSLNLISSRAAFWNTVTLDDNDDDNDKIQWQIILLRAKQMIASVNIVLCSLSWSANYHYLIRMRAMHMYDNKW